MGVIRGDYISINKGDSFVYKIQCFVSYDSVNKGEEKRLEKN